MKRLIALAAWGLASPASALPKAVCDFAKEMTPILTEELASNPTMMMEAGLISASDVGAGQFDCSKGARSFRVKEPEKAAAASTIKEAIEPTDFYHVPFCVVDRCPLIGTFVLSDRGVELASFGEALFADALETGRARIKAQTGDLEVVSVPHSSLDMLVEGDSLVPLRASGELPERLGLKDLREIASEVEDEAALDPGAELETIDEWPLDPEAVEDQEESVESREDDDGAMIMPIPPGPPGEAGSAKSRILSFEASTRADSNTPKQRRKPELRLTPPSTPGDSPYDELALGGLLVSLLGALGIVLFLRFRPGAP